MVSETCHAYLRQVDAAATCTGSAQDVLSILDAAQKTLEASVS